MPITRTTGDRLIGGILNLYKADADLIAEIPASRMFAWTIGAPADVDLQSVTVPMLVVFLAPSIIFETQVGGASKTPIAAVTALFAPVNDVPSADPSVVTWYSRMVHTQKLQMRGNDNNNQGRIVNPDNPNSPDPVQKYVNDVAPEFRSTSLGNRLPNDIARLWSYIAVYATREDIVTRERV